MQVDDETWAAVRRAYDDPNATLSEIAARFALSRQRIVARAKKDGWPQRQPARKSGGTESGKVSTRRQSSLPTRGAQRALIGRLYRAISTKLEHMEMRMASGEVRSAQDEERESRALATLINNFEKVTEAVAELDQDKNRGAAAGSVGADAERMRREIAERLERLGGGGTSGGEPRKPRP